VSELYEVLEDDMLDPWVEQNPLPIGGRAALGAAAGGVLAALAAAAFTRLRTGGWNYDQTYGRNRNVRLRCAAFHLVAASAGAAITSPRPTRTAATIGTAIGVVLGELPFVLDPDLVAMHPVLGNIWIYALPIGGALIGANVVR